MRSWAEPKGGLNDLTVLWQVIPVLDCFYLPSHDGLLSRNTQRPLIPSLSGCLSPCPNGWKLPKFCLKKRQKPKLARCLFGRNTDSFTWWLLFVHINTDSHPQPSPFRPHHYHPPLILHTPKPFPVPCPSSGSSSGHSVFQMKLAQPGKGGKKKKKLVLRRASCAGLKEMLFSPSFPLWGVAAGKGWSLGGLPTKGKVCGHWGFRASPHRNQKETSAEIVKAGLVADQLIHFLLKRLLDSQV